MQAVEKNETWSTRAVTTGESIDTHKARDLMNMITESAHICGDPGIQFDTTINDWHTCPKSAPIRASNPCSEYMFVDNSACNLASLNLLKFTAENGDFDIEAFRRAVHLLIIAQEIIVDHSSYPNEAITDNSHRFRPLGLGYANLGALLMFNGHAYDSPEGRALAGVITALMTGQAYLSSAILASAMGTFAEFELNRDDMLRVLRKHVSALDTIELEMVPADLIEAARDVWSDAVEMSERYGCKNAQVTVLAPTGTIGFMMDCDTTGIEPDIALVKYKNLVGGGMVKLVNHTVGPALSRFGYDREQEQEILEYIEKNDTIEGAPHIKNNEEQLAAFDCAFKPVNGARFIHHMGHVRMMAAVQPFLSGAISKTVNMPNSCTSEQIADVYMQAWKLGLKSIAIYRDGSKRTQPLSTGVKKKTEGLAASGRKKLPDERGAVTHKFSIAGHDGYITVGEYEDGTPGELFIVMAKEGSVVSGLMDSFATAVSIGLQYGVPLKVFVNKFSHTRFEPYGFTNNPKIPIAKSISDYIFRWLGMKYLKDEEKAVDTSDMTEFEKANLDKQMQRQQEEKNVFLTQADAPPCHVCGRIMVRNGSCYKCTNCGSTSGCS